jgi:hypothetical protein
MYEGDDLIGVFKFNRLRRAKAACRLHAMERQNKINEWRPMPITNEHGAIVDKYYVASNQYDDHYVVYSVEVQG